MFNTLYRLIKLLRILRQCMKYEIKEHRPLNHVNANNLRIIPRTFRHGLYNKKEDKLFNISIFNFIYYIVNIIFLLDGSAANFAQ
jgi:hypothetical protein